jgi:hypothetical protein
LDRSDIPLAEHLTGLDRYMSSLRIERIADATHWVGK